MVQVHICPFESEKCGEEGKIWISWEWKELFFIVFEGLLFSAKIKNSNTTFKSNIVFKIKTGYTHKLRTKDKMILSVSTENDIISIEKNRQNVPKLEATQVVLLHCNMFITIICKSQNFYLFLNQVNRLDEQVINAKVSQLKKLLFIKEEVQIEVKIHRR